MGAPGCPTPTKKGYRNRATAKRHMWQLLRRGDQRDWQTLGVYQCACGMYHVGHRKARR